MESKKSFLKVFFTFLAIIFPWTLASLFYKNIKKSEQAAIKKIVVENYKKQDSIPKVDHSKFKILQQDFKSPQDVTDACLSCHNLTDHDIMKSSHWKWTRKTMNNNHDSIEFGKKNALNNFCIAVPSNEARCTSCHIGYGWKDKHFDFAKKENIDCMVCHDQTGTYKKFPTKAGLPVDKKTIFHKKTFLPPNYKKIAQNVGSPKRENCGACHFFGGGGNNIKHGDLSKALIKTHKEIDVHMGIDGANMSCVECHKTEHHDISGQLYSVSSKNEDRVTCAQCHSEHPHKNEELNLHSNKVSCQACHIPEYAKVEPTKMYWDWSKAGKKKPDGSLLIKKDSLGNVVYHTMKGSFKWGTHLKPEYVWFNGTAKHYFLGDKIKDASKVLKLNTLLGNYKDKKSKIYPVKIHRGRQIYDKKNMILINPHLFGKDSTAYWKNFDWNKAAATGMAYVGMPYSGKYGFINTEMYWPLNHMVSESSEALTCTDCHSHNGRLQNLNDFYLLGRNSSQILDWIGVIMIALTLIGVSVHALLRIFKSKKL